MPVAGFSTASEGQDGTLIDCDPCFASFTEDYVDILRRHGFYQAQDAKDQAAFDRLLWEVVGYRPAEKKFTKHSVMVRGSQADVMAALAGVQAQNEEASTAKFLLRPLPTPQSTELGGAAAGEGDSEAGDSKRRRTRATHDQIMSLARRLFPKFVATDANTVTCANVKQVLEMLRKRGCKIAICTSDNRDVTMAMMTHLQVAPLLDEMACGNDPDLSAHKPSPEGILKVCRSLAVDPKHAVMVGDSVTDVQAGASAGCSKCIFVLSGGYENEAEFWTDFSWPQGAADCQIQIIGSIDDIKL